VPGKLPKQLLDVFPTYHCPLVRFLLLNIFNHTVLKTKLKFDDPTLCLYVGTEFKTTACPITGIIRYMEIQ
jgi:hypothetical protein